MDWIGAVIVAAAREMGRSVFDVAAEPFAATLYTVLHIREADWRTDMRRRFARIDNASLTALAFHKPERLRDAHQDALREAHLTPSVDDAITSAHSLIEAVRRVDAAGAWHASELGGA